MMPTPFGEVMVQEPKLNIAQRLEVIRSEVDGAAAAMVAFKKEMHANLEELLHEIKEIQKANQKLSKDLLEKLKTN